MNQAQKIADSLSDAQRETVLHCEQLGNGKFPYQLHGLAQIGLMSKQVVEKLMGIKVYRLTPLGKEVKVILEKQDDKRL